MSDANNEISKTVSIQSRTALGLTLGLACSIPLTAAPALAGGNGGSNHEPRVHAARQNLQLNALQQLRAERRAERRADRLDASLSIQNAVHSANFNLNSGRQAFSANNLGNFQQLTIDVGGTQRVVNLDSKLSAAELVAAQQVLNGGVQTIELRSNGAAAGGSITLNNSTLSALDKSVGGAIGSLTVARGVQVIDNNSGMNLSGNLRNHGTISAASDSAGQTITISADTINNSRNASIGTYSGNAFFGADVTLNASTSITNNGSISSANTLTLNAPVISNINDGSVATLSAGQNVNLNTANLANTGLINANAGNINVNSSTFLNFAGAGGTLQAKNGSINLTSTNANLTVSGGDLLSQDVNLSAGKGNIEATFGQADGVVNAQGCIIHLYADSDLLNVGTVEATDDPIIANVSDVVLNATLTAGAPLTVISGGNITANGVLDTSGPVDGGDLTLIAGAQFKLVGANVNVSKKSTTGGSILVAPGGITTSGGTGDAGDIIMVAYAGKTVGSGQITTTGAAITAKGASGKLDGNVQIIAAGKTANTTLSGINAGSVTIQSAEPVVSKGGLTFDGTTGQLLSGSYSTKKLNTGTLTLGGPITATGAVTIGTAGILNANNTIQTSGDETQQLSINAGTLNLPAGGKILTNDKSTLNLTTPGDLVIDGTISVGTLNLSAKSLNITASGALLDAFDNIKTAKGGNITVNGNLGRDPLIFDPNRPYTTFNVTAGGAFVIGDLDKGAVVSGDGQITATSFTNNTLAKGNTTYTATGTKGVLFTNNGTVDGTVVTINAVNGSILNASGADLQATQQLSKEDVPILTLNTLAVNNLGHIEAVGELKRTTGTLNINSTKALTITGVDGGFFTAFNSTVNLSAAKGDVIVGGNDGVVNSSPFSLLSSGLGNFSVKATGVFRSTMPGISVSTDGEGKQGTVSLLVKDIEYNGLGAAPNFKITAVGDAKVKSVKVLTINTTDKSGIVIGNGAGEISTDISGYNDGDSSTTIITPQNLTIDSSAFKIGGTSLTLTGTKNLLISGNVVGGKSVTINTGSKAKFEIGNAKTTGFTGLAAGEGITAGENLTINATGAFVMNGSSLVKVLSKDKGQFNLNGPSILVNNGSDIDSLNTNLVTSSTKASYTNLNPGGALTGARLNITTPGVLTLSSGGGNAVETFLSMGLDFSDPDPALHGGGTFNLKAASLKFSTKGITFSVPGVAATPAGGLVKIDVATKTVRVGLGNGAIRANVANFAGTKTPDGAGELRITNTGTIVAQDVLTGAVNFGAKGGSFELISTTSTVTARDVANFGKVYNLFHLSSNSTSDLLATNATKNGVLDKGAQIFGGNIVFENFGGKVVTNGANLDGVRLELNSTVEVDARKNPFLAVGAINGPFGGGGEMIITAPLFTVDAKNGILLIADGADVTTGGRITVDTSSGTQALKVAPVGTGGAISIDVSNAFTAHGGQVTIKAGGALDVDGNGLNFGATGKKESALNLQSGQAIAPAKGSNLVFRNAASSLMNGLDFGTITIDSGSTSPFKMNLGGKNGNGIFDGNIEAGKLVIAPNLGKGIIDTTGYAGVTHDLTFTGKTVNFDNQTISVVTNGAIGDGTFDASGGKINISAESYTFSNKGPVTLQAVGAGVGKLGGVIKVNQDGIAKLEVGVKGFLFDVSNPGETAGDVGVTTKGDLIVDGNSFNYGAVGKGKLSLTSDGNMLISNIAGLTADKLAQVDLTTNGAFAKGGVFQFGSATKNGFVDVNPTLQATVVTINSTGINAGVDASTGTVLANSFTIKTSGNLNLLTGGGISVVPSTLGVNAGAGGTLNITANALTQTGTGSYTLSAAGTTIGGIISVTLTGTTPLTIGPGGLNIDISNDGAGSRGGSVTIKNNSNIIADMDGIKVGSNFGGAGPNVALSAKGILSVNNLDNFENIGLGGGLSTVATVGGVATAGYNDTFRIINAALPGGFLDIVYVNNPGDTNEQIATFIAAQVNNNVTLQGLGITATRVGAELTLNSNVNGTTYDEFTSKAPPLPADQESPLAIGLVTSTTGLTLESQSSQAFVLGGAKIGSNGIVDNNLNLNIGAVNIANTGTVVVAEVRGGVGAGKDSITVTDPLLPLGSVTVETKTVKGQTREQVANDLANQINLNVDLQNAGVTATVNGAEIILVATGNSTTFSAAATGTKLELTTEAAGGNIQMGTLSNLTGSITQSASLSASGSVGTKANAIVANGNAKQNIVIAAGADAFISSTSGAGTLAFSTVGHTEATFTGANDVTNIAGTVGDLRFLYTTASANKVSIAGLKSTNGDLYIESKAQTLEIGGTVSSNFGNIVLQNTNGTAAAKINIIDGTKIHGSGAVTALNQGNVYITIGLAPPAFVTADGVQPAGTTLIETGNGQVTFGSAAFPAGTITSDPTATFEALGRNLAFSTGALGAGAITVGKDAVITADPPPMVASSGIMDTSVASTQSISSISSTLSSSRIVDSAASNAVANPKSTSIDFASGASIADLTNALSVINTVSLNNAQLSDLSLVQNASLNAVQASNTVGLLSNQSVGESPSLAQTSAAFEVANQPAAQPEERTLIGHVSNLQRRSLKQGPLLVAPENDIVVETPHGTISVAAKTLALLVASDSGIAVYNLHDIRKSAVTVTHKDGHQFNVTPGTSAVIGTDDKAFEDVNPAQFVRYRQPIAKSLGKNVKLHRAEFEIMSLLNGLPAFKELMASENKSTRKTMLQTLKTAAILMQLSPNGEPFKFFSKAEITAMTKTK